MLWMLMAQALAADVHVLIETDDWKQAIVRPALEPYTETFTGVVDGKSEVAYTITWPPTAHSAMDNGFPLNVQICRIWAKGKKKDKDCITEKVVAKPESEARSRAEAKVKLSDTWTYTVEAWATGDDIPSTALPMEPRPIPGE